MRIPIPPTPKSKHRGEGPETCLICDRRIKQAACFAHLLTSGELADHDEIIADGEDQGFFAVGSECARKLPAAFRFIPSEIE